MSEVAANALEIGTKEPFQKISGEIFEKPGPDIKPQWKPKTEVSEISKVPAADFKPQWKESPVEAVAKEAAEQTERNKPELSKEDKERIKEEIGWSDEIIDAIRSPEEYEIYKNAGLEEKEVNGKPCLVRNDINLEQKDEFGRTNQERMKRGLAPLDKNGQSITFHHIGQEPDSPFAELTQEDHRGKGNDTILHDKNKESEIDRKAFDAERAQHWETRAEEAQRS